MTKGGHRDTGCEIQVFFTVRIVGVAVLTVAHDHGLGGINFNGQIDSGLMISCGMRKPYEFRSDLGSGSIYYDTKPYPSQFHSSKIVYQPPG